MSSGRPLARLQDAELLDFVGVERIGGDLRIVARMAGRDPLAARVLFAQLALHAPEPDLRASARLQLAWLLREAGLGGAAARLFLDREAFDPALHAADLRRLLGEAAAASQPKTR